MQCCSSSSGPTPASSSSSGLLEFITSEKGKSKLIHDGCHYTYHQTRNSGHVAWRCVHNNKSCRTKGISCSATTVTTGTTPSSSLEYAKPHSHLPDPSTIAALNIIDTYCCSTHRTPSNIVSSNLIGVVDDVECHLPAQTSMKKTVRRRRPDRVAHFRSARNTRIVNLITSYTRATADSFLRVIAFNYV